MPDTPPRPLHFAAFVMNTTDRHPAAGYRDAFAPLAAARRAS
jgi:hypothetical protein